MLKKQTNIFYSLSFVFKKIFLEFKLSMFLYFFIFHTIFSFSQENEDLFSELENEISNKNEKVLSLFKGVKLINSNTVKTTGKGTLEFNITHRFGSMGIQSNGGAHTLWGFDNASNIMFSLEYGISKNLMLGIARSKINEHLTALIKYRFLNQTVNNSIPVSIAIYANTSYTPKKDIDKIFRNDLMRLSYAYQIIIARKFDNLFSFSILPTFVHRNLIINSINLYNNSKESNDLFALGSGVRIIITKRFSIVADFFYTFSKFRLNNPNYPYYMPFALGVEIETGGHVFHINLTNSAGIVENDFLVQSPDSWTKGGFKFGFNISRVFKLK